MTLGLLTENRSGQLYATVQIIDQASASLQFYIWILWQRARGRRHRRCRSACRCNCSLNAVRRAAAIKHHQGNGGYHHHNHLPSEAHNYYRTLRSQSIGLYRTFGGVRFVILLFTMHMGSRIHCVRGVSTLLINYTITIERTFVYIS